MKKRKIRERLGVIALSLAAVLYSIGGTLFSEKYTVEAEAATYEYDEEFEDYLTEQGFPESYKDLLRQLHADHPNWVFTAFQTGIEWDTAVENEMIFKRNLVPDTSSYPSSYKDTTLSGSYDWVNDEWIVLSSPYWVQASQAIVEYYMDPRNFLTDTYIFQFEQQTYNADVQNLEGVEKILEGTFMSYAVVEGTGADNGNSYIFSDTYAVAETYLYGLEYETTVEDFLSNIYSEAGEFCVLDADGEEKSADEYVGTGDVVQLFVYDEEESESETDSEDKDEAETGPDTSSNDEEEAETDSKEETAEPELLTSCTVILYGDLDGNGQANALDRAYLKMYVKGNYTFSDAQTIAADVNRDDSISSLDRAYLKMQVQGNYTIDQSYEVALTYGEVFMQIAEEINVSPYTLASRVREEQGVNGTSLLISGTVEGYEGYYNYYNIQANGTTTEDIITNGLDYAVDNGWDTRYKALLGGATVIAENYISKGQDTLYLQKFDVDSTYYSLYWHQYMQNLLVATSEGYEVYLAYVEMDALDEAFVFKIPVYENMPDTVCEKPTADGNPNYKLKSLSIQYYSIDFDRDVYDYYITVPKSVKNLKISAEPYASTTSISGIGTVTITSSTKTVTVKTTAENGDTAVYTIHLTRS